MPEFKIGGHDAGFQSEDPWGRSLIDGHTWQWIGVGSHGDNTCGECGKHRNDHADRGQDPVPPPAPPPAVCAHTDIGLQFVMWGTQLKLQASCVCGMSMTI
jgi:hypothetical protein